MIIPLETLDDVSNKQMYDHNQVGKWTMETFGERFKRLRNAKNLTQKELAQGLLSDAMLYRLETGKGICSKPILELLAERLDTTLEYLLYGEDCYDYAAWYKQSVERMEAQDFWAAIESFQRLEVSDLHRFDDRKRQLYFKMGVCLFDVDELDRAVEKLDQALRMSFEHSDYKMVSDVYGVLWEVYRKKAEA